jgi:hypothetical protein
MPKASININDFGRGINTVKNPRDLAIGEVILTNKQMEHLIV